MTILIIMLMMTFSSAAMELFPERQKYATDQATLEQQEWE